MCVIELLESNRGLAVRRGDAAEEFTVRRRGGGRLSVCCSGVAS